MTRKLFLLQTREDEAILVFEVEKGVVVSNIFENEGEMEKRVRFFFYY